LWRVCEGAGIVLVVGVMFGGASKFFAVLIGLDGWVWRRCAGGVFIYYPLGYLIDDRRADGVV
jgi:hypothetical protein